MEPFRDVHSVVSEGKPYDGEPQMATRTYPGGF